MTVGSGVEMRRLTGTFGKTIKMRFNAQVYNYTLLAKASVVSHELVTTVTVNTVTVTIATVTTVTITTVTVTAVSVMTVTVITAYRSYSC
jgi:hypothetical protein